MPFPNLPGVPALFPVAGLPAVPASIAALTGQNLLSNITPVWGIFDSTGTNVVLEPDSFLSIEFIDEMNISSYPIEKGQFSSFNKVQTPYKAIVKVTKGSSASSSDQGSLIAGRDAFLAAIDALVNSLDLCTIVTPEAVYQNANLEEYDYRREVKNGAGIIIASLRFVEILSANLASVSATTETSVEPDPTATQSPSSQAVVQAGTVQSTDTYSQPVQPQ